MRKLMLALVIVAGAALPMVASVSSAEARVFCYSKSTGQFLNWGHCRPVTTVCTHYGPGGPGTFGSFGTTTNRETPRRCSLHCLVRLRCWQIALMSSHNTWRNYDEPGLRCWRTALMN